MTKYFAVKSEYFSLYQAFKQEAEKVGWKYDNNFNPFVPEEMDCCSCLYFHFDWHGEGPKFSFSNHNEILFDLQTQWDDAIKHMHKVFASGKPKQKFEISLKNLADHHGVQVEDIIITA